MPDIVKIVFEADLQPLRQDRAEASAEIDRFVSESEAKIKGIKGPADILGGVGDALSGAGDIKSVASSGAATTAITAQTAAETALTTATVGATAASGGQAVANVAVAGTSEVAAGAILTEAAAVDTLTASLALALAPFTALIVVAGSLAAAGVGLALYASKNKELAEQQLAIEENLAISQNQRILGIRDEVDSYQQIVDRLKEAVSLSDKLKGFVGQNDPASIKALRDRTEQENQARAAELGRLRADLRTEQASLEFEKNRPVRQNLLTETGLLPEYSLATKRTNERRAENNVEETKKQIAETEAQQKVGIDNLSKYESALTEITQNQGKVRAENFQNTLKNLEDSRRKAEEERVKFIQSVKEGNAEVLRLVKGYKSEFSNLFITSVSDNPFAQQMIQNSGAVADLKEKLAGVNPELRKTALGLLETANAAKTYTLQIDSAFQTVDLRAQGDKFRNPTQRELTEDFRRKFDEFRRTSNSTNPDVIAQFRREAQEILDTNRIRNQRIVDEKLDIAETAKTPAEQAIADRAVTQFAGGLNPDDLTREDRSRIADAFERSAIRNETRQEEALTVQKDLLTVMKAIDKRGEILTGIAGKEGKAGVERATKFQITLKDDTSDKKATAAAATSSDVSDTYSFPIAGPGGTNF